MIEVKNNELLKKHTSFKIGGEAGRFYLPKDADQLAEVLESEHSAFILGGGSNILVSDSGVPVVVATKELKSLAFDGDSSIKVGAGFSFTALSRKAKELGLKGLEFAFGIPGTVGGAVIMNAGASGGEVKDILKTVEVLKDGKVVEMKSSELSLSYRSSLLPDYAVIVSATFSMTKGDKDSIEKAMKENNDNRKSSQPLDVPSAGSIFKNPEGSFAGKLIEDAGLKGECMGDALVSDKHANFIVNRGKATASDVYELIKKIERMVFDKAGIKLQREIKLVGVF